MPTTLLILSNPTTSQASYKAYEFAKANPKTIKQIFFYSDGVYQTLKDINIPTDEFDITKAWQLFAKEYQVELHVCIGSAARRGVNENTIANEFKITGMAAFMQALKDSQNVLTFN